MNTITTVRNRITAAATVAVGAGAVAIGALALSAPASAVTSIQPTCVEHPNLYADGATLGVYSTQKHGFDRDQICKLYDPSSKLLGVYTTTDYGYYKMATPVTPPPVLSAR
ncbi:hypothetical protein [Mycobacterium sp. OAE908]|uniref:hypothetical protein n=1 Tax=Mycobacterium sp. OAE908 TaxID=2817899 RepID=UPI001AEB0DF6